MHILNQKSNVVNDRNAITYIGKSINDVFTNIIESDWLSGIKSYSVAVNEIDNVKVNTNFDAQQHISLVIPRNKIARTINAGLSCEHQVSTYLVWTVILSILFLILYLYLPYPLTPTQLDWKNYLIANGYDEDEANQLCKVSAGDRLTLNESQQLCYDRIHSIDKRNHQYALQVVSDPRVADLDHNQMEWFIWALANHQNV